MFRTLFLNVLKLSVTLRMLFGSNLLDVSSQMVIVLLKQPANHGQADAVILFIETFLNIAQATVEPFPVAHRVTDCMRGHDG